MNILSRVVDRSSEFIICVPLNRMAHSRIQVLRVILAAFTLFKRRWICGVEVHPPVELVHIAIDFTEIPAGNTKAAALFDDWHGYVLCVMQGVEGRQTEVQANG